VITVLTAPLAGTTTTIVTPTGDNNRTTAIGSGNNAATLTGNNNTTTAIGRNNLAATTGLFGTSVTNTPTGPILNVPATGNDNKNIAIGHNQHKP